MDEETIFHLALEKPASERAAFLAQACGGDAVLLQRMEALLKAHDGPANFLKSSVGVSPHDPTVDPADLMTPPGTIVGQYKLLEPIGEGGYGTVFMAEQTSPVRRKVALKIIKAGMDTRQVIARFEAERQALALMDHPNIAKVFDAGMTESGKPYFVMELVKGVSIIKYCDQHHLPPRVRLELFVQVCQAVQHAHTKGIIHRDLKPSNVLIALYDGKPIPKVIDFGVAKATGQKLTEATMFTSFGDVIGTFEYMSPEQAELNQLDVDTRSDIYSLGVLLYELLTGSTPLENKRIKQTALLEVLRFIREEEPQKPSVRLMTAEALPSISASRGLEPTKLSGLVRGELDWIVMKALEKDRTRRYETANGMAMDVQRYLDDEAVHACPPSSAYRFRKFVSRHRSTLAAAALLVLALLLGSIISTWQAVRATRAEALSQTWLQNEKALRGQADASQRNAEHQTALAEHERDLGARQLRAAQLNLAAAAALRGDLAETVEVLEKQRASGAGDARGRGFGWHYLWALCHEGQRFTLRGHRGPIASVKFAKNGSMLISGSADGTVRLWDATTGQMRSTLNSANGGIDSLAISPDGATIAAGSEDGTVTLWTVATGALVTSSRRHRGAVKGLAFSPDGTLTASSDASARTQLSMAGEVCICNTVTGREIARHPEAGTSLAFSPDGNLLALTQGFGGLKLFERSSWKLRLHVFHRLPVLNAAFSPDGKSLASGGFDGEVKIWDVGKGELHNILRGGSENAVCSIAFSSDGTRLACGRDDGMIDLWDFTTGSLLRTRAHGSRSNSVAFSPDGASLASGTEDGTIILRDAMFRAEPTASDGHSSVVWSLVFAADGRTLASTSDDGTVKLWDVVSGRVRATLKGHTGPVLEAVFSPDSRIIASGGEDQIVRLWDAATGQPLSALDAHRGILAVAFSPDGKSIACGCSDVVQIFDVVSKSQRNTLTGHSGMIWSVAYSEDGSMLASAGMSDGVGVWDAASGHLLQTIAQSAYLARFSPNDQTLEIRGTDSNGYSISFWNLSSHSTATTVARGMVGGVGRNIAFLPDGSGFLASNIDGSIHEIDTATGEDRVVLPSHGGRCWTIACSPDGRTVATGSWDGKVRFLRAATEQDVQEQGVQLSGRDSSMKDDGSTPRPKKEPTDR